VLKRAMIKFPAAFSAALLASATLVFAQANPPATGTTTGTTDAKAKAKPLSTADKAFVKKAGESLFFLSNLSEKVRGVERDSKVSPDISDLAKKLGTNGDVGKAWGEIGQIASSTNDMALLPAELKGADKTKVAALGKLKDQKFEKEVAELILKESKDVVRTFESGSKSANNPELKAIAEKYLPTLKGIEDDAAKAKSSHK